MSMDVQHVIEAMDGVVLVLDRNLAIANVGWKNWHRFWRDNNGAGDPPLLGDPITDHFAVGEVRDFYREVFTDVSVGRLPAIHIDFRCDSPTKRRAMRLSVTPIEGPAAEGALLYQSILLSENVRPALPLFAASSAPGTAAALPICSICHKVKWPGGPSAAAAWIEPQEYYRRGGPDVAVLSHGFCISCHDALRKLRP